MKNLLFNSFLIVSIFLIASCSYSHQTSTETASDDTIALANADTTLVVAKDTTQAISAKGDSVAAQSTRVESSETGTVNKHPGAVSNPGANQAQTDSIKKAKTKGKKKN